MTDQGLPGNQIGPVALRQPTVATSGGTFVYGKQWARFDGALAVAALKDEQVLFLTFDRGPAAMRVHQGRLRRLRAGAHRDPAARRRPAGTTDGDDGTGGSCGSRPLAEAPALLAPAEQAPPTTSATNQSAVDPSADRHAAARVRRQPGDGTRRRAPTHTASARRPPTRARPARWRRRGRTPRPSAPCRRTATGETSRVGRARGADGVVDRPALSPRRRRSTSGRGPTPRCAPRPSPGPARPRPRWRRDPAGPCWAHPRGPRPGGA